MVAHGHSFIPGFKRLRQENCELEVSLGYILRPFLKIKAFGEMAPSIKSWHELGLVPSTPMKVRCGRHTLVTPGLGRQRWKDPWGHWPACLAYSVSSRPMRERKVSLQGSPPSSLH